jgi:hypothetical protein
LITGKTKRLKAIYVHDKNFKENKREELFTCLDPTTYPVSLDNAKCPEG